MAMMRESFFECSCVCEGQKRTAHVRAWTASGARRLFLDLLETEGIRDPVAVSVAEVRYHDAPLWPVELAVARAGHAGRS